MRVLFRVFTKIQDFTIRAGDGFLIAHNLAVEYNKGFLKDEKYRDAALLAAIEINR